MVVSGRVRDAEAQYDSIDEARLRQGDAGRSEVIAGVKDELVFAGRECAAFGKRRVAAAVRVGDGRGDKPMAIAAGHRKQFNPDARSRPAVRRVEHVSGEFSHRRQSLVRMSAF